MLNEEHLLQSSKIVWLKVEELCGRPLNLNLMQNQDNRLSGLFFCLDLVMVVSEICPVSVLPQQIHIREKKKNKNLNREF